MMLRLALVLISSLAVAFGAASPAAAHSPATPKYSSKGSGFHHTPTHHYFHTYWTGGTSGRQTGRK